MRQAISAGRLRDYVEIIGSDGSQNKDGELIKDKLIFDARAEVKVKSGDQMQEYGSNVTSTIITCLMYYDARLKNKYSLRWNGQVYSIKHSKPDTENFAMIVTAEIESND